MQAGKWVMNNLFEVAWDWIHDTLTLWGLTVLTAILPWLSILAFTCEPATIVDTQYVVGARYACLSYQAPSGCSTTGPL